MSEIGPDVDGDDSGLKEYLLEALKADGTLKQIQDQLSAAVYAAFYRQTTRPVERTPSHLNTLISRQNGNDTLRKAHFQKGITAASLLVDFLQSLGLKKTLNVLMHETGLGELNLELRDDLIQRYNLSSVPDKTPILPVLLEAFANLPTEPLQLSKGCLFTVELDQDSDNGFDKPFCNNGSIPGNLDSNFSSPPGIPTAPKDQHQRRSPPHLVDSAEKIGELLTLSSGVHQSQQQSQRPSRLELEKEGEYAITTDPTDDRGVCVAGEALPGSSTGNHLQETPRSATTTGGSPSSHAGGYSSKTNLSTNIFKPPQQCYSGNVSDVDSDIDSESPGSTNASPHSNSAKVPLDYRFRDQLSSFDF
ncbi:unnamed protein product [Taenia asiatica]|uniref:LisH domain-containing protein n=1 Tax=Taenia asiatica TaxID=60517 RepID=A0A158R7E0_TAEAS|nr:unnamed protein product [Taenia asiatica]